MSLKFRGNAAALGGPVVFIVLLALSLVIVTVYSREGEGGPVHSLQNAFSAIVAPVSAVGEGAGAAGDALSDAVANAMVEETTLSGLRDQNAELRSLVARLEEYRQEAQRLQGLLDLRDQYDLSTTAARVVGRSGDSWNEVVTIDKGSEDGVSAGLPVMAGSGLVGQVIATTPHTADVRLLTDQQSGVAVLVQSNRAEGIVRGSFEGLLYLESLPANTEVKVGDVIVTSGLGGSFFRGLVVGEVVSVEQEPGDTAPVIVVNPNADASSFEEVLVVTSVGDASAADGATSGSSESTEPSDGDGSSQTDTNDTADDGLDGQEGGEA